MQLELRSAAKKLAAAVLLLLAASAYLSLSATRFLAAYYGDDTRASVGDLKRAAFLDSGNADYPHRIGWYELERQSPQEALPWLRRATALDPRSAQAWIDLATAQQSAGDVGAERMSLEHALAAGPRTPGIAWQAANLYLARGSSDEALKLFHAVLENHPAITGLAITTCWAIRPDIDFLLDNLVPPDAFAPLLEFLVSRRETAAAGKVWERLVSLQEPVDRKYLFDYLKYLLTHQEPSQAALVWQQAAALSDLGAYQRSAENQLVNGDFGLEILNAGFDWRHQQTPGVTLALDPSEVHSGLHSLRLTFDGLGVADAGVSQMVPVEPNTKYEFSAFYKAVEMDGAGGLEFEIQDTYRSSPLFMGEDLRNADFWKTTGGSFVTGPDTHLITLGVARVPPGRPIRGKLWIDGLQLVRSDDVTATAKEQP